jgi:hypothetical protein
MLPLVALALPYIESALTVVVMDRLAKFGKDTKWDLVKLDTNKKVRDVFPEEIFGADAEDEVVLFIDRRISDFATVVQNDSQGKLVLDMLLQGDLANAWKLLRQLASSDTAA